MPKGEGTTPDGHGPHDGPSPAVEKLKSIGMVIAYWHGNCEANAVSTGTYDVGSSGAGMYALVFDNTFSKSLSKTATFVLLTYPTYAAAQTHSFVRHSFVAPSTTNSMKNRARPKVNHDPPSSADSSSYNGLHADPSAKVADSSRILAAGSSSSSKYHTGVLLKRRRKRHQGYARRFFSLDFTSNTLSYYHDRNTLSIRGAVPLSLAAIATHDASRDISIDSGAEIWHLRAVNKKDFEIWKNLLEQATQSVPSNDADADPMAQSMRRSFSNFRLNALEDLEWQKVEELISRISVSRDMARRLARDTDPKYLPLGTAFPGKSTSNVSGYASSSDASPIDFATPAEEYFAPAERQSFWKRKANGSRPSILSTSGRKVSAPSSLPSAGVPKHINEIRTPSTPGLQSLIAEEGFHGQCVDLMQNLDSIVSDFSKLITETNKRRQQAAPLADSRVSMESAQTQEFFDADAGDGSQLLTIHQDSDGDEQNPEPGFNTDEHEDSSASDMENDSAHRRNTSYVEQGSPLFPVRTRAFSLPPTSEVSRRTAIPPATQAPPSLIGFLRKNVGKDLSTISMPVSANEPLSLLQKMAEVMEYSALLDDAGSSALSSAQRILRIAAFAVSAYSSSRAKERSIRKPFNPMLGETFELIREDRGYRFLAEKISHRPVRMAWHAEAADWTISQTTTPSQQFWGKSIEFTMDGLIRLNLHSTGDQYSWTPATSFLRNIIAGEKYVEPVNSMTINDEKNSLKAVVEFAKLKGLFAGRSEDLTVRVFRNGDHTPLPEGLVGKWTTELLLCDAQTGAPLANEGRPVWRVGSLVPSAPQCYGFTTFAASLNEVLPRDEPALPPSDSRLRPDQRSAEHGDLDTAEALKVRLEEAQRERRRAMEAAGEVWTPAWFTRNDAPGAPVGEEVWKIRSGKDGYWDSRARGDWKAAKRVLEI